MAGSQTTGRSVRLRWMAGAAIAALLLAGITAVVLALTHEDSAPSNADGDAIPPRPEPPTPGTGR